MGGGVKCKKNKKKLATRRDQPFYHIYYIYNYLRFLLFTMSSSLIMCLQPANLSTTNNT